MKTGSRIAPGSRVTLHLALTLPDGTQAYSSFDEEPVTAVMGDGSLDPGIELALYALRAGDTERITLQAGQAYGRHDPALVQTVQLGQFAADHPPLPGQLIAFTTPAGDELAGLVLEVGPEAACIDFNHPLAGRELLLQAEILAVDDPQPPASEAE